MYNGMLHHHLKGKFYTRIRREHVTTLSLRGILQSWLENHSHNDQNQEICGLAGEIKESTVKLENILLKLNLSENL